MENFLNLYQLDYLDNFVMDHCIQEGGIDGYQVMEAFQDLLATVNESSSLKANDTKPLSYEKKLVIESLMKSLEQNMIALEANIKVLHGLEEPDE